VVKKYGGSVTRDKITSGEQKLLKEHMEVNALFVQEGKL